MLLCVVTAHKERKFVKDSGICVTLAPSYNFYVLLQPLGCQKIVPTTLSGGRGGGNICQMLMVHVIRRIGKKVSLKGKKVNRTQQILSLSEQVPLLGYDSLHRYELAFVHYILTPKINFKLQN